MLKIAFKSFVSVLLLTNIISCAESFDAPKSGPDELIVTKVDDDLNTGVDERVIYGDDDRKNLYEVTQSAVRKAADSTVALIRSEALTPNNPLQFLLPNESFGKSHLLCTSENFYSEPAAAFCSGSMVGNNLILTAGHCIATAEDCASVRFVFGYALKKAGGYPLSTPSSEVYSCKKVLAYKQERAGADYALIELDRKVTGHVPLKLQRTSTVKVGDALTVIGHPSGLPTKIAAGGVVRKVKSGHFVSNLDTYGGNSGSAVFNSRTLEVVGILVRGDTDFVSENHCAVSKRCSATGCRGEDVTRIEPILSLIR